MAELNQEMIEDLLVRKRDLIAALGDEDQPIKEQQELSRQLRGVLTALGDPVETGDELVDQWERDLEEGRVPDLEA